MGEELDASHRARSSARIASPEGERRLSVACAASARRSRSSSQRRAALARQLDSAGLALGNLRLDLIKLRSSGLQVGACPTSRRRRRRRVRCRDDIDAVLGGRRGDERFVIA